MLALIAMWLQQAKLLGIPVWAWYLVAAVLLVLYIMRRRARKAKSGTRT